MPMLVPRIVHLGLLGAFLTAAGCSASKYNDFRHDEEQIRCDLHDVCFGTMCDYDEDEVFKLERCERFDADQAQLCIESMEDYLVQAEADPTICADGLPLFSECYLVATRRDSCSRGGGETVEGRPLTHDGHWVLAEITTGDAWSERTIEELHAEDPMTQQAARRWLRSARAEHASIAAFSRISLELMSVGAPPELLEGCHRAAMDEVRHARMALDVARALGGESWDFGPLPSVPTRAVTLRQIALDALLEGCIGEGAAAAAAHIAAARAREEIAEVQRTIAVDETRHAGLAWATLRWALREDPSLAEPLRAALVDARAERSHSSSGHTEPALARLGVVAPAEARGIEREVIDHIVGPVLSALLDEVAAPAIGSARPSLT